MVVSSLWRGFFTGNLVFGPLILQRITLSLESTPPYNVSSY